MNHHLRIRVTLLDPLFHGKGDREAPEWPPSPMRLFQALLAGSRTGCRNRDWSAAKSQAYRWLERREPPLIVAPTAQPASGYTLFVPNNDADKESDRQKCLTGKIVRPQRLATQGGDANAEQTLHYIWVIPYGEWAESRPHAEVLCSEARGLTALGWGIDQAVADGNVLTDAQANKVSGPRWLPWRVHGPGQRQLRVPTGGSLADLEAVHASFVRRIDGRHFAPPLKAHCFSSVAYLPATTLPPRSYAWFEISEGVAFRQEDAVPVAAMVRSLACRSAKSDSHEFPGGSAIYVAGHTHDNPALREGATPPRFSFLPIPTIGHERADGMIRRVLIAEPYGGDGAHARWAQERLRGQVLRDTHGNERGVLLDLWRGGSEAMVQRYAAASRAWATVTPVILPGFDDGKQAKAEKLFLQAVEQAGLSRSTVSDLALRKAPFWPGSQHSRQYRRPRYLENLPGWHVRLAFREPVPGPLALGAGRHCGLGVFARMEGTQGAGT